MRSPIVPAGHIFQFLAFMASPRYGILPEPWHPVLTPVRLREAQRLMASWGYPVDSLTADPVPISDMWVESYMVSGRITSVGKSTPIILVAEGLEAAVGERIRVNDVVVGRDLGGKIGRKLAVETLHLIPWWGWVLIAGTLITLKRAIL